MSWLRWRLSSWEWWVGAAYFGLAIIVVWLYIVNGRTTRAVALNTKSEAIRVAAAISNANSQYHQCLTSIPQLQRINRFLHGVQTAHAGLYETAKELLAATEPSDPLYPVRVQTLRRSRQALNDVRDVKFPIPTSRDCAKLRKRLMP